MKPNKPLRFPLRITMITCKACEETIGPVTFKAITYRHLKTHHDGMTLAEYRERWPDAPLRDTRLVVGDELPSTTGEDCQKLIGNLRPVQQEYIAARLQCKTKDAAARLVGISPTTVYNWKERLVIEAIIARIQTDAMFQAMHMVLEAAPEAVQNIRDLQFSHDDRVALAASKDIADRAGVTAKKSAPSIDITIYKEMPPDRIDEEIVRMLADERALEAKYKELE